MNNHLQNKPQPLSDQPDHGQSPDVAAALRMLGLAVRAGQAAVGRQAAIQAIRRNKGCLVWLAEDTSADTREKISRVAVTGSVNWVTAANKSQMGQWSGRESCAVVVIVDQSFSKRIRQLLGKGLEVDEEI